MANTTTLEIHPAIGIARLGTSQEFFIGPEPGGRPIPLTGEIRHLISS